MSKNPAPGQGALSERAVISPPAVDPLALHADPAGDLPVDRLPAELRSLRYVNGEPVLKNLKLHGWPTMREILLDLATADAQAARERRLDHWSEAQQRSQENAPLIRAVVERAGEGNGSSARSGVV